MFEVRETKEYEIITELFREYAKIQGAEACFVSFEKELTNLEQVYHKGALMVAYEDSIPIGCGALKKNTDEECEMKRVFIKPNYRKKGYGGRFIKEICNQASLLGYKRIVLQTIPKVMNQAYIIYKSLGFKEQGTDGEIVSMSKNLL